ncbi:MAG: hypothetical protein ACRC41_17135 [Sarcina sp.]
MNDMSPIIKITNLTDKTMRDIRLTYDGLQDEIDILKIKKEYEKVVFLDKHIKNIIRNLKLIYNNNEFLIVEEVECKKELVIDIKISNKSIDTKINCK